MENFLTLQNFKTGSLISELKFVCEQPNLKSPCCGSKEVEIAESIDELVTSRSIARQPKFPDFDVLDAVIASALKKLLNTQSNFQKRVSVEEQRAQNSDRFVRGRQIAYMIYEHFRPTGAYEAVQGLSDLIGIRLQNDDVQDFDVRWDQALPPASEMPSDLILERLHIKTAEFCSTSHCDGLARSRNCSKQWNTEQSAIISCSETSQIR